MSIVYRTAGTWGAGKGSNLSGAEVDANFYQALQALAAQEASPLQPHNITAISFSSGALTITTNDGRSFGPYTVPQASLAWKGDYSPGSYYNAGDLFAANGNAYLAVSEFVGESDPFEPSGATACVGGQPTLYDLAFFCPGLPNGSVIFQHVATRLLFVNSVQAYLRVAPGSNQVYTIKINGESLGTFSIASGSHSGSTTDLSGSLAPGDVLTVVGPGTPSGSDLSVTLLLQRVA
jgi:hypothetical protein